MRQQALTTVRTVSNLASATVNSALGLHTVDKKSSATYMKSINKSMAKLEQISQMNWSKKDQNLDVLATGNQVFNKVQTTVDPRSFAKSEFSLVNTGSRLSKNYTVADQEGFNT